MSDLFKKLNTLVKSRVNSVLSSAPSIPNPLSKKLDKDVNSLRQRINEAIDHETSLQAAVRAFEDEIALLDQQADEALQQGNDAGARHILEKIQRARQRMTMAESDLREHQLAVQDLIQRVNLLEATVADARYDAQAQPDAPEEPKNSTDILNDIRHKITVTSDKLAAKQQATEDALSDDQPIDDKAIDDDLENRRNRLSKR